MIGAQGFPSKAQADDYTIRVEVDEVVLHATAQDHKNVLVSGLGKETFRVYEDGVLQEIRHFSHEDIPVTVGLVVDNSGSTRTERQRVIAAAVAFAHSSNPHDQMFVVNFNEQVSFGLPNIIPFTDDLIHSQAALSPIAADGDSDGGDNASKHKLGEIRTMAGHPGAIMYTIGVFDEQDGDRNPYVLRQLAKDTGSEAFLPESVEEVVSICEQIARDIRTQYTIAYVPTNRKRDGSYRIVQVLARAPGHGRSSIRTRAGYYAPMPSDPPPKAENNRP